MPPIKQLLRVMAKCGPPFERLEARNFELASIGGKIPTNNRLDASLVEELDEAHMSEVKVVHRGSG